jgi:branched-chain amino acid transport system substrate-binding protein
MRFCILGPLEAWEDGREVQLGPGRQRALVALLLLHANEVVSTERLIDAMWNERPPTTATKVVQGYVSQLRKALPDNILITRPTGYLLRAGETDAGEFERLVERARTQEPGDAVRTIEQALRLWRGSPLADVEYEPWAQTEIGRLEELRLEAIEDRIDADLQLGRHQTVVPKLEALVAEHPLRERLRGLLMLAYYRSARQADALDAYADARRRLVDELGIEPGPELQDLQRRILAQDPELGPVARPRPLAGRRRARLLVLVGGVLAAGAVSAGVLELMAGRGAEAGLSSVVPDSLAVVDAKTQKIVGQVPVPDPWLVATGGGTVWVASDASRTVSSIPAEALQVTHVVTPNATPSALAADGDAVWVLDGTRRVLEKLDPTYGAVTSRINLPRGAPQPAINRSLTSLSVSVGAGALWVTDGSTRLFRVDPETRRVSALDVGRPLDDVAVGAGAAWAISGRAATVFQVDTRDRQVTSRIPIVNRVGVEAPFPVAVAVGEGSVWVLNGNTQTVTKIDPELGGVSATIPLGIGSNPTDIAAGAGGVWVANGGNGTLTRIDPNNDAPTLIALGSSPAGVAVGGNRVWVTVQPGFRAGVALPRTPAEPSPGLALPASSCTPLEYDGKGQPRFLIASDLPFQGQASLAETLQMSDAIRFVLAHRRFRAGAYSVGYQSCDDSIARTGNYDVGKCKANAEAYAADKRVIGMIGGYNSGCSQAEIPVLSSAPGGPVAMISSASTYVGLTHAGPGTIPGEPRKYYPSGKRNFVRVIAADDVQGAANALLARKLGVGRLYVLDDGDPYGFGIAANVRHAARKLGLRVVGFERWDPHARTYQRIARKIQQARADAVFLGGTVDTSNGAELVKSLRAVLGGRVRILTPDGFTPISAFAQLAGPAAEGVTVSFPALAPERLRGKGKRFVAQFEKAIGRPAEAYSVATAQDAETLLDAIAHSSGTRASVTSALFKTKVTNGILGGFSFDHNGDTTAGAVTIYRIVHGAPKVLTVITPQPSLVR